MNPTLRDLAKQCGVDISTVSRALNGSERVKEGTRQHILNEAERLGYRPNLNARRLKSGQTKTVYFILPSLYDQERIPAEEATRVLAEAGYDTLLAVHHNDTCSLKRMLQRLREGVADGALIISSRHEILTEGLMPLVNDNFPIIFLDRPLNTLKLPVVTSHNSKGASQLVDKMRKDGVRHFLLNIEPINAVQEDRIKGFHEAIEKYQLKIWKKKDVGPTQRQIPVTVGLLGNSQGCIMQLLHDNPWLKDHPMVFGVFDDWKGDVHPASHAYTAIQDFESMGAHAAKRLLKWLNEGGPPKNKQERVPLKEIRKILPLWN